MFLATTALTEFWDKSRELRFLGIWCLPQEKKPQWQAARGEVMPSPWDEPGRSDEMVRRCEALQEKLLEFLGKTLNENLGTDHGARYWRILLGPWAMAYATVMTDHWLHLETALRRDHGLETITLDSRDFIVPRDTNDYHYRLLTDSFHLQIYSEIFSCMGKSFPTRRLGSDGEPDPRGRAVPRRGLSAAPRLAAQAAMKAMCLSGLPKVYFSDMYLDHRQCWSLIKASRGRLWPIAERLPESMRFAPETGSRRSDLAKFPAADGLERAVAAGLPKHFPTLFLEGFQAWRGHVLGAWRRPPKRLLTSVGWFINEYFKMLAAEAVEGGGRLAICQHGGAYGTSEPMHTERHERAIADEHWTWGWTAAAPAGARSRPMPNPRLWRSPNGRAHAGTDLAYVGTSFARYPYLFFLALMPASHRFTDYLKWRDDFIAALPAAALDRLNVHLYNLDLGWGHREHLSERFPGLRFETTPWTRRLDHIGLLIIDHPITSLHEALGRDVPTILFWDPALWNMRAAARPAFDALRRAGILYDTPEAAAAKAAQVIADPTAWWAGAEVQSARAKFCAAYALGAPDWAQRWSKAAQEL
jgi:putative transferase (TIGR04331 family)